jgi:hypothetical protein
MASYVMLNTKIAIIRSFIDRFANLKKEYYRARRPAHAGLEIVDLRLRVKTL